MDRRTFLAGTAGAALTAAQWATTAAKADELPLGPLPGTRYPEPQMASLFL